MQAAAPIDISHLGTPTCMHIYTRSHCLRYSRMRRVFGIIAIPYQHVRYWSVPGQRAGRGQIVFSIISLIPPGAGHKAVYRAVSCHIAFSKSGGIPAANRAVPVVGEG